MAAGEYWQLMSNNGEMLPEKIDKDDILVQKLLHGAAHVWIWRNVGGKKQVLLQRRAGNMPIWPSFLDISAAGHTNSGESPLATAVRETREEIGLSLNADELFLVGVHRRLIPMPATVWAHNEFSWIYLYELKNQTEFSLEEREVESVKWVELDDFVEMTKNPDRYKLVPQGSDYFAMLLKWL
jgi:isopentenyldiphosphate isomerase